MRLEINSGGLDSFFNGVSTFINSASNSMNTDKLIKSIEKVADKTGDLTGGIGNLSTAIDYINTRKTEEENRRMAIQNVKKQTELFIDTAIQVDKSVATAVNISKEEFYKTNPWLRPPEPMSNWDKFWGTAGAITSACWDGIVQFYEDHPIISKIFVGAVFLGLGILTGGAAFVVPALIGAGVSTIFGAAVGFATGGVEGALHGAANGFMFGGIGAFGAGIAAASGLTGIAGSLVGGSIGGGAGGFIDGALSGASVGEIICGTVLGAVVGGATGVIADKVGGYAFSKLKGGNAGTGVADVEFPASSAATNTVPSAAPTAATNIPSSVANAAPPQVVTTTVSETASASSSVAEFFVNGAISESTSLVINKIFDKSKNSFDLVFSEN